MLRDTVAAVAVIFDSQGKGRKRRAGPSTLRETAVEAKRTDLGRKVSEAEGVRGTEYKTCPQGQALYHGEFDPGSERTLAARFKHASRTATLVAILEREWRTGE